jgi:hypothetical protein
LDDYGARPAAVSGAAEVDWVERYATHEECYAEGEEVMTTSTGTETLSSEEAQRLRSQLSDLVQRISTNRLQEASASLNRLAAEEPIIICVSGCG